MRKNVFGKRLSRDTNERQALFKSLLAHLVTYGRIETTEAKSKAIKGLVDKTITAAKKNTNASQAFLGKILSRELAKKVVSEIAPRFSRSSGFTRITKIGSRISDNAALVVMEWVEFDKPLEKLAKPVPARKRRKTIVTRKTASKGKITKAKQKTETKKQEKKK